uniref:Uncharacterized protein n=1 Tax=Globodera rostochiensis TaxID=31243 RepID=A0A914I2X3_GLORO
MDRTTYKDAVVATGALGIGVGLAATQFGLLIGSAAANLMLDCLISTKNAGKDALNRGLSIEQAIEKRIYTAIEATQEIAKNPSEQLTAHANTFLDIANSLSESILGIPRAVEDPESGLKDRVTFLASRIATRISSQTNERIIEPLQQQMCVLTEQLSKCIVLQRQEWTFNKTEAMRTRKNPGEVLLQIIRFYSSKLNNQMGKLRDRSSELLSSSLQTQIQSLTMYVQKLDDNFAKAESIDDVKQEVIEEAKHKLFDIARWSASLSLRGPSKDTATEDDDNDDKPKQYLQKANDDDEPKQHLQKADDDDNDDEPKNPLQEEEEGESSEEQQ